MMHCKIEKVKSMKRFVVKIGVAAVLLVALSMQNAAAIGAWVGGKVTKVPWQENGYTYIQIGEVRYTIMKDVKLEFAYKANNMTVKEPIKLSSLRQGDAIVALAEGNRIYQIEKQQ